MLPYVVEGGGRVSEHCQWKSFGIRVVLGRHWPGILHLEDDVKHHGAFNGVRLLTIRMLNTTHRLVKAMAHTLLSIVQLGLEHDLLYVKLHTN